jgi:prephenate dehydratase
MIRKEGQVRTVAWQNKTMLTFIFPDEPEKLVRLKLFSLFQFELSSLEGRPMEGAAIERSCGL